jgi:hypothetical protein
MTTTTYDYSHREAVQASRNALTVALATLEVIDQGSATAAERLGNVTGKLRSGDTTVTATQLRNAKDEVERFGYLHAGAANAARSAENGVVNDDTSIAAAIASRLQGDGHGQFPVNAVVGVNPPTADLVNPLRPMLYVQQVKPANLSGGGYETGDCMVSFYSRTTLEKAPDKVSLFRMLQAAHLDIIVDSYGPPQLGGPAPMGYRIVAKNILPSIPTLRGGPQFDGFLKARGQVALSRLMKKAGLNGVVSLGAVTVSGPSDEDGITTQTIAVRIQVGAPHNDQWGGSQDVIEAICLEAAHAALKVDGPYGYVGNLTAQEDYGKPLPTIALRTVVRTLSTDAKVTAEATAVFTLKYRYEDAPEDVTTGNPDDVVKDATGEERYRWEING